MNAGTELGQLAACFVLPVGDSMEEIFDAVKYAALIHKSGGGTGFSFSRLRPRDARVGSTGGIASGPISFLRIFNTATEQVKQGGTRRGANMGILRVDHPDILNFIKAKEREGELNNFNLSVGLTEEFMQAVDKDQEYALVAPHSKQEKSRLKAREVFSLLVQKAWESGDPGIVFLDRINRDNPTPDQGEIESTNPCGEQPLLPYEACNLGSINLSAYYDEKDPDGVDWEGLRRDLHLAVRFLDNVIDASEYPLPQITEMVHKNRKIGLGVMGFADLLFALRIPYNSQEAVNLAEKLMAFVRDESRAGSKILAMERGAFPAFATSTYALKGLGPFRNATTTTIAPTGTLSILAACSSGVEPLFALSFVRTVMDNDKLVEVNPIFEQAMKEAQCHSPALMEEVAKKGSVRSIEFVPEDLRKVFVTAMDIEPMWHLMMQAAFQKYTDNAVSKTVNLPNSATKDEIWDIYWKAFEYGCKGVTVYRDGCKANQVLCTGEGQEKPAEGEGGKKSVVRKRPGRDLRLHPEGGDRPGRALPHGERDGRPPVRGLRHHRQVRPLHHGQGRGHRAAGVAGASQRGGGARHRGPAQGHRRRASQVPQEGHAAVHPGRGVLGVRDPLPPGREGQRARREPGQGRLPRVRRAPRVRGRVLHLQVVRVHEVRLK